MTIKIWSASDDLIELDIDGKRDEYGPCPACNGTGEDATNE